MDYVEIIERSPCLKELFEFVFKSDVSSAYNKMCEHRAMFEFEYEPCIQYGDMICDDRIDCVEVHKYIDDMQLQVYMYIHSILSDTPNLYLRFYRASSADFVEHMLRGISAFSILHNSDITVNRIKRISGIMLYEALEWTSDTGSYDILDKIEEYATCNNLFDKAIEFCDKLNDMNAKAVLLNAHNNNPNAYKSESLVL